MDRGIAAVDRDLGSVHTKVATGFEKDFVAHYEARGSA
jgi:hypothetical protein